MIIGVTGGIASGKSTLVYFFKEWGASVISVIDVDKLGWQVLEKKQNEVIKAFGKGILNGKKIDRRKLGKLVFADKEKKEKLDSIIHPPLIKELKKTINSQLSPLIVVDCALIYEWGIQGWFDKIILVTSSNANRVKRLLKLGYDEEEAKNRIKAQLPDETKAADWVIENDGNLATLKEKAKAVWEVISQIQR